MPHDLATVEDLLAHAEWMRDLAQRLLGDRDEANDVVQEAWINALRVPPTRGRTLRPWIATVILNLVRSRARRRTHVRAYGAELSRAVEVAPSAEETLAQHETERRLAELVLGLAEPYRRTILRRFHDGHSSVEIARDEGVAEGTIRWRIKYGLDELRRGFSDCEDRGKTAFGALIVIAGPPGSPSLIDLLLQWLAKAAAVAQAKAVVAGTGAAAAVIAVVAVGVQPELRLSPRLSPATKMTVPRAAPALPSPEELVEVAPAPALAPTHATSPTMPPPAPTLGAAAGLTTITGVVRDSRGDAAVNVPVTVRSLDGSGAADRTTITDGEGRFSYQLSPHHRVLLTAELKDEPAARLEIPAPAKLAFRRDDSPSFASTSPFATIDVGLAPTAATPRRKPARASTQAGQPLSRWCCRQAFLEGSMVYGRACLRFDDNDRDQQSGCELYGLKAQVSCHQYTEGGLSTGDLSRTDRLGCGGKLL